MYVYRETTARAQLFLWSLANPARLLIVSLGVSLGILFVFSLPAYLHAYIPTYVHSASAATLSVLPQAGEVSVGQTVLAELRLDTEGEVVNALSVTIAFDPRLVEVAEVTTGGSAFSLWPVAPVVSNERGTVELSAGAPGGFLGQGLVARLSLKARSAGNVELALTQSEVLRHSPQAEPLSVVGQINSFTVVPAGAPAITMTSEDHEDENAWYNSPFIRMAWPPAPGATYSYVLSRSPTEQPDEVADEPVGEIKLDTQEDGVFYFHLRECVSGRCGPTVTRRAMKDTLPPEHLDVAAGSAKGVLEGKVFLSFAATDATSGIAYYEVREGEQGDWQRAVSPYVLGDQSRRAPVWVRAYDLAGNVREVSLPPQPPVGSMQQPWFWAILGVGLLVLMAALYWVFRRVRPTIPPQA